MKAPVLVMCVVGLHVGAIGLILMGQGCRTMPPPGDAAAPPPVMPPREAQKPEVQSEPLPVPPPPLPEIGTYTVQPGDTLSAIAQRLDVHWRELAELNALEDPYVIREGQSLLVPGYSGDITAPPEKPSSAAPSTPSTVPGTDYEVKAGDTLSEIAQAFGVRWRDVAAANDLEEPYRIRTGQTLRIPGASERPAPAPDAEKPAEPVRQPAAPKDISPPSPEPPEGTVESEKEHVFVYRVVEGDTPESIAHMFLVSVKDLMRVNNLTSTSKLQPGQSIKIPQTGGN